MKLAGAVAPALRCVASAIPVGLVVAGFEVLREGFLRDEAWRLIWITVADTTFEAATWALAFVALAIGAWWLRRGSRESGHYPLARGLAAAWVVGQVAFLALPAGKPLSLLVTDAGTQDGSWFVLALFAGLVLHADRGLGHWLAGSRVLRALPWVMVGSGVLAAAVRLGRAAVGLGWRATRSG